jgi:hypothetical protein
LSKKILKLFAVLAFVMLAAGAASAQIQVVNSPSNDAATYNLDTAWPLTYAVGAIPTIPAIYQRWPGYFNSINGAVTYSGSFIGTTVDVNARNFDDYSRNGYPLTPAVGNIAANPRPGLVVQVNASTGGVLTIAPGAGRSFGEARAAVTPWAVTNNFPMQVIVNTAGNTGTVVMRSGNNDTPTAQFMTNYRGGTVVEAGTLAATNNNALGLGWVGLLSARTVAAGATLTVQVTDLLQLGINDPAGAQTLQPLYLLSRSTPNVTGPEEAGPTNTANDPNRLVFATINADQLDGHPQRINLLHGVDQRLYLLYCTGTVGSVCDSKPSGGGFQYFHFGLAFGNKFVHHQGDEIFAFQVSCIRFQKLRKIGFRICKIVGRESPHVHRNRRIFLQDDPLFLLVDKAYLSVDTFNGRALHYSGKGAFYIRFANTTRNGSALAQRIPHVIAHHAIIILPSFHGSKLFAQYGKTVTTVEIVGINHGKRLENHLFTHENGMIRTPGLFAPFRNGESGRQLV